MTAVQKQKGLWQLGLCSGLIAFVWLLVLPWVATQPRMAAHLEQLRDQGVDPSAMFYTELDAMEPILQRLERR